MSDPLHPTSRQFVALAASVCLILSASASLGGGLTMITHGYDGDITGWVNGTARAIPDYYRFPGTNFSLYSLSVTDNNGFYYLTTTRIGGDQPSKTDSGEILIELDWSQLAGGIFSTYSTYSVATAVAWGLLQTNLVTELGEHALAEMPIHLVGHSRGGSLMSEVSRLLGTNGIWVDHLTTLDPHPLNNDGFFDLPSGVDAPVRTYANVLFHDNYWQDLGNGITDPDGEQVAGAYSRQLRYLAGGYFNAGSVAPNHANTHLWYYGTIDFGMPATDTEASISSPERDDWWNSYESFGVRAGFQYSLIGGGDRLSPDQPLGPGSATISEGYNHFTNRTALISNSGEWPNLVRFDRLDTNVVTQGGTIPMTLQYEWAKPGSSVATIAFYLDDDFNPLNNNDHLIGQSTVSGAASLMSGTLSLPIDVTNAAPGVHSIYAKISGGNRSRYLYAPELVQVVASGQPPTVSISSAEGGQVQIAASGSPGQTVVLETSADLAVWLPLATNTLTSATWVYQQTEGFTETNQFYRTRLR